MAVELPACSGVFARAHCPHPRLFEDEYKRSNRNRGTKILRCFPHCCPHHVDRSYCGSPLEVQLRFGDDTDAADAMQAVNAEQFSHSQAAAPFDVNNVHVFARFETVDDGNHPAGAHSLHYLRSVSQSETNPEASWIEGVRQTPGDTQQHSLQLHGRQPTSQVSRAAAASISVKSATFVLNGQAFSKWYYHWESGANKVQRATKHALKAYVFYQTQGLQQQQQDSSRTINLQTSQQNQPTEQRTDAAAQGEIQARSDTLELLCVVSSPPFTVVSYRRAPLDAAAAFGSSSSPLEMGGFDPSTLMPHYATDSAHPVDSRLRRLVQHQISQAFQSYNQHQRRHQDARGLSDELSAPGEARSREENKESQSDTSSEHGPFDRYRQLQEREGLNFRLLTPEDAARSGSSLHGQVAPREPRLVFDRASRRSSWRDAGQGNDASGDQLDEIEADDDHGDAVPRLVHSIQRSSFQRRLSDESKSRQLIGVPPPSTGPMRQLDRSTNSSTAQLMQHQHQLETHQRELQQLTDLMVIHFFASLIPTSCSSSSVDLERVLTLAISQHWRCAASDAKDFARLLLAVGKDDGGNRQTVSTGSEMTQKREELVLLLGEISVWAFSAENLALVRDLLVACHPLLLGSGRSSGISENNVDGQELLVAFLDCIARCWSKLENFLQSARATQSTIRSVHGLSDAVLGAVFSDPELQELRCALRDLLQRPAITFVSSRFGSADDPDAVSPRCNLLGWRGFVAQVREGYLREQYSGCGLPWSPLQGSNASPSRWTADWELQPSSLRVSSPSDDPALGTGVVLQGAIASSEDSIREVPSLWTLCLTLSQLCRLKLAVAGDPLHTFYVQAEPSVLSPDNAWLRLICDGRVRVAPVAPNGLTSLCGGSCGFGGDYVAYPPEYQQSRSTAAVGGSGRTTPPRDSGPIRLEFYWWPTDHKQSESLPPRHLVGFRTVATLDTTTNGAYLQGHIELERGLVGREAIGGTQSPELELWGPTQRVQSVLRWQPWLAVDGIYTRK